MKSLISYLILLCFIGRAFSDVPFPVFDANGNSIEKVKFSCKKVDQGYCGVGWFLINNYTIETYDISVLSPIIAIGCDSLKDDKCKIIYSTPTNGSRYQSSTLYSVMKSDLIEVSEYPYISAEDFDKIKSGGVFCAHSPKVNVFKEIMEYNPDLCIVKKGLEIKIDSSMTQQVNIKKYGDFYGYKRIENCPVRHSKKKKQ
jgi:hypothetical protein